MGRCAARWGVLVGMGRGRRIEGVGCGSWARRGLRVVGAGAKCVGAGCWVAMSDGGYSVFTGALLGGETMGNDCGSTDGVAESCCMRSARFQ